ncbi:MAG: zinc metalloprotease HtpX [Candidatus Altiarchaeales archaeon ex4484_96]|nr:MAG: zinc metalloprotease HtpX [Candidatus Altiarchaeales archaeon ex4484_96]
MSMDKISFFDQIERNKRNSWILIFSVFLFIVFFAWVIAQVYDPGFTFIFLVFGIIFSLIYTVGTYRYSDTIALKSVNAYEAVGDRFSHLRNQVEGLALGSGLPTPRVYVMPSADINAFASGRDPKHSVVCVTEGALNKLSDRELEAVLAHEMTHIRNYDIRFVTLVAVMVGIVSIVSEIFLRSMWFGGGGRDRGRGNALFLVFGIILAILAPIIVRLVQLSISRKREYMADAGSVQLTRTTSGMISALKKIKADYGGGAKTKVNAAVAPMFLADPVGERFVNLFKTHPPIDDRIKTLKMM